MRYNLEIFVRMKAKYPLTPPDYNRIVESYKKMPIHINGKTIYAEGYKIDREEEEKRLSYWTKERLFKWRKNALEKRYHWVHRHYGAIAAQLYYEKENMKEYDVEKQKWPLCDNDIIRYREENEDDEDDYDDDDADCMNFQCNLFCPFLTAGGCTYENYL